MLHVHFDVMLPIARIIRPAQGVLLLRISDFSPTDLAISVFTSLERRTPSVNGREPITR